MKNFNLQEVKVNGVVSNPEVFFLVSNRVYTQDAVQFWEYVLTTMGWGGDDRSWRLVGQDGKLTKPGLSKLLWERGVTV